MRRVNRVTEIEVTENQTRSGVRTRVIPRIDRQSLGDSILSSTSIPWIRSRNIEVDVARLKLELVSIPSLMVDQLLIIRFLRLLKSLKILLLTTERTQLLLLLVKL